MTYKTIRLDLNDKVATITIDRPHRMNALTPQLFEEASAAIDAARANGARALILTGEGRAFCAGADLVADEGYDGLPDDLGELLDNYYNPFVRKLADLDIPVISAINGPAVGAGMGLALTADITVMARSAYLLLAFVNIGLVPDAGVTWLIAKGAGRTKALELALLGEKLSAEEALDAGLVTRVADDEAVLDEARAIATKLAHGPSVAIGYIRKQVAMALNQTLAETLETERKHQSKAGFTEDFREAVAAFGEKRKPIFKGR
ncbi:enoyl-CoA hydratase [Sphingomonas sp. Root710]|uniref:enoyl-CoA hydratase-related protein n=1 Tax=Sphingomonas sp. Root710 TaxID=1736594 RepID=UPI0006F65A2F|nr:enoyl-CoA hydratase-related protein [Sphingomonas sp. Root710]KRB79373.1 enoyl-CoA hydratase [Sphingomonas sp. Root710]